MFRNLNPAQQRAVMHTKGPLLVVAGAGSGKTRVITYRIAKLINEEGVKPYNILALTFTNKASMEMKQRIESLLGQKSLDILVSTFHSACLRILRRDIEKIGYSNRFVIYDSLDQIALIKHCLDEIGSPKEDHSVKSIANGISLLKTSLREPMTKDSLEFSNRQDDIVNKILPIYQKHLKNNNALDFDDILILTVKLLLSNQDLLAYYQNRFHYILVDEYQDTNYLQYKFVYLLAKAHQNICVVGDEDQSIYGWRGANIDNILNFEKSFKNALVIKLEENYRSTRNILDASNNVIRKNKQRKGKTLFTKNKRGNKIIYYRAFSEIEEGDFISRTVKSLCEKAKATYKDIAVFYRTNAQSRVIEDSLRKSGIAYQIIGGLKFYDRKEIKDIIAYCRFVVNSDDSISFNRIIKTNMHGIGKVTMDKINNFAMENNLSPCQAIRKIIEQEKFSGSAMKKLKKLNDLLNKLRKFAEENRVSEFISFIQLETGYIDKLLRENSFEARNRIENLKELVTAAKCFDENNLNSTVNGFLDVTSLASDIDDFDEKQGAVALMTLHSSKGLEFPMVFIAGMEDKIFPHVRSFYNEDEMEEERRLCYVGMTRAKNRLFLLNAVRRKIYGTDQENPSSQFLNDIPDEFMENVSPRKQQVPKTWKREFPARKGKNPAGKKVNHPFFGDGIILKKEGTKEDETLVIFFKRAGKKTLKTKYANLKIL